MTVRLQSSREIVTVSHGQSQIILPKRAAQVMAHPQIQRKRGRARKRRSSSRKAGEGGTAHPPSYLTHTLHLNRILTVQAVKQEQEAGLEALKWKRRFEVKGTLKWLITDQGDNLWSRPSFLS